MCADARFDPVMNGTDLQVDRFQRAEGALHAGQVLVGAHRVGSTHRLGRQAGADDIDPVETRLARNGFGTAAKAEAGLTNSQLEMLGHLVVIDHGSDSQPDLSLPAERSCEPAGRGGDTDRSRSVAVSSASRLRVRSRLRSGLRQTTK